MRGLLVIGHGSRRDEANATVRAVATTLRDDVSSDWTAVEPVFLEMVQPDIATGYARLVAAGCTEIVVHPFFLFDGNHTARDIPEALSDAAARFPGARWTMTAPLGLHPGVLTAVQARIDDAVAAAATA